MSLNEGGFRDGDRRRMSTLKEVAALAGVSMATASAAINKGPVSKASREKVLAAAKQLNYVPSKAGRMLMTGKSNVIEMVIMTIEGHPDIVRRTALFYYLMLGVSEVAEANGFGVRYTTKSHDAPDLTEYFDHVVGDRSADGIIIVPQFARDYSFLGALRRAKFPHVLLRPSRNAEDSNYVDLGDYEGGRMVGQELVRVGASSVALINGPQSHLCAIERERGLSDSLLDLGGTIVAKSYSDYTISGGYAAMAKIFDSGKLPEAVFCTNDYMAAGAMNFLRERGVSVPRDIAVIGYDDSDLATVVYPALTTLDNRFFEIGQALAEELISVIKGETAAIARSLIPIYRERASHNYGRTA